MQAPGAQCALAAQPPGAPSACGHRPVACCEAERAQCWLPHATPPWHPPCLHAATMDCSPSGCSCWDTLSADLEAIPLVLAVSGVNGAALQKAVAAAAKSGAAARRVTVVTSASVTSAFSGTSMATPHVSGVAARVWANYPNCPAAVLRKALEKSAKPIGGMKYGERTPEFGHGLVQTEGAYDWLAKQPCAKNPSGAKRAAKKPTPATPKA